MKKLNQLAGFSSSNPCRERVTLRMALYVLIVCGVGISLAHLAIQAAMRSRMYEHQRVLSALTPMLPDDRQGVKANDGPVHIPGSDAEVDLRGVAKGALVSTSLTDRAYCRGLRPSILWSDGKCSYQLAAMHGANHDWDATQVLLGFDISVWLKDQCGRALRTSTTVERWVVQSPFDDRMAAFADHERGLLLIVTSLPGRQQAFDDLLASPASSDPLQAVMGPRLAQIQNNL